MINPNYSSFRTGLKETGLWKPMDEIPHTNKNHSSSHVSLIRFFFLRYYKDSTASTQWVKGHPNSPYNSKSSVFALIELSPISGAQAGITGLRQLWFTCSLIIQETSLCLLRQRLIIEERKEIHRTFWAGDSKFTHCSLPVYSVSQSNSQNHLKERVNKEWKC